METLSFGGQEVDRAIQAGNIFTIDHVQIRRHLIDSGMLQRTPSGDQYRLCDAYLSLTSWDPAVIAGGAETASDS